MEFLSLHFGFPNNDSAMGEFSLDLQPLLFIYHLFFFFLSSCSLNIFSYYIGFLYEAVVKKFRFLWVVSFPVMLSDFGLHVCMLPSGMFRQLFCSLF